MCIRDRVHVDLSVAIWFMAFAAVIWSAVGRAGLACLGWSCLLYTSDAADERSSVDLGGRRFIKKKNQHTILDRDRQHKYYYTTRKLV